MDITKASNKECEVFGGNHNYDRSGQCRLCRHKFNTSEAMLNAEKIINPEQPVKE